MNSGGRSTGRIRSIPALGSEAIVPLAEGIETEEQLALISTEEGIEEAQGYLFSPPIPGRQIRKLLRATSVEIRQVA